MVDHSCDRKVSYQSLRQMEDSLSLVNKPEELALSLTRREVFSKAMQIFAEFDLVSCLFHIVFGISWNMQFGISDFVLVVQNIELS